MEERDGGRREDKLSIKRQTKSKMKEGKWGVERNRRREYPYR